MPDFWAVRYNANMGDKPCKRVELLIVGSGPAGWAAALYAARANLRPVVISGIEPGGQLTTTTDVENWPADVDGVQGPELMTRFENHARRFGAELVQDVISVADFSAKPLRLVGDAAAYECDATIIAAGASAKYLELESETAYRGRGVSACATCDGFFHRNRPVVVVGGGNTAAEEVLYLSGIASRVTLVHRRDSLRAEKIMQDKLFARSQNGNVDLLFNHVLAEVRGDESGVTAAVVRDTNAATEKTIECSGVFIAIGHTPNTAVFVGQLEMENGYIKTRGGRHGMATATSAHGVFAAGDVQDSVYRQAVTSAGSGCMAALDAQKYLESLQ